MKRRGRKQKRGAFTMVIGAGAALVLFSGALLWLVKPASSIGGPFALVTDTGKPVTDRSFPGKYLAVYFGYTKCPDVCPGALNSLTEALTHLDRAGAAIQPIFITLDPARDSPSVLHRYVSAFSPNLLGLTGTAAALRKVQSEYRVVSRPHPKGGMIDHSSVIYLMAPDGGFVAPIAADADDTTIAQTLARYVAPAGSNHVER